ncbi:hypothetical protein ACIBCT_35330 [Streptosporangium sp. NPDC050855]|uniref:hypothetical protein n=1 Tax=Streptosporangium sp. NPDC050855 TaxID=3366194 RepID=UPI0037A67576
MTYNHARMTDADRARNTRTITNRLIHAWEIMKATGPVSGPADYYTGMSTAYEAFTGCNPVALSMALDDNRKRHGNLSLSDRADKLIESLSLAEVFPYLKDGDA